MNPEAIIRAKRDGVELSADQINDLVAGFVSGAIPDYQMSAFLMAVIWRGMTSRETGDLTQAMLHSGDRLVLPKGAGPRVDKHSTGGVGDVVSLPLVPLAAVCGARIPMIAGRGLGHTGGTLDKLESIPGFRTDLDIETFTQIFTRIGCLIGGQSESLVPADRRMYALRDVTATVESIPLIVSSILSKKAAAGVEALVLDVKCGRGAFMKEESEALALAQELVRVGSRLDLDTVAFVTDMDLPLGRAIGNAVEVDSAIACLCGSGPEDVMELVYSLGAAMLALGNPGSAWMENRERLAGAVADGSGREKFRSLVAEQGGDPLVVDGPRRLPPAPVTVEVVSPQDGYVVDLDPMALGRAVLELGGGRRRLEDRIDPGVGVLLEARPGDRVDRGQVLARTLGGDSQTANRVARDLVIPAFAVGSRPPRSRPLLRFLVTERGTFPWGGPKTWEEGTGLPISAPRSAKAEAS